MTPTTFAPPAALSTSIALSTSAWRWARDWALIGGFSGALAPWLATSIIPNLSLMFPLVAAMLGTASGAIVGLAMPTLLDWAPKRARPSVSLVLCTPLLGAWGAAVAAISCWLCMPNLAGVALICGSVASTLQFAWLAPAYTWLANSGRATLPFAVLGPLVGSPIAGMVSSLAVLVGIQLMGAVWL